MDDYQSILDEILAAPEYQENLDWGEPRPGHPEGSTRAHIAQLEANLAAFEPRITPDDVLKLRILIHAHDTFKRDSVRGVAIAHPSSHASLARAFLARFCYDHDLLAMVQLHDEPFALFWQFQKGGKVDDRRLLALLNSVADWDLFVAFLIIDGCTPGKDPASLRWFLGQVAGMVETRWREADLLT